MPSYSSKQKQSIKRYTILCIILCIIFTVYCVISVIVNVSPINSIPIIIQSSINNNGDNNSELEYLEIFDNKANLLQTCSISSYYDFLKPSYRQPYITNNICYTHVHKCGGTTIMNLFKYLYSKNYIKYLYHPKDFYEWMFDLDSQTNHKKIILFTFIRDPIDRFISGFYEMKRRNGQIHDNDDHGNKIQDLMEMRLILRSMMELKDQGRFPWNIDKHLWPQLLFLVDKYGNKLRFNYIGLMDNMNITLPLIMQKYENVSMNVVTEYLNENIYDDSRSRKYDKVYKQYTHYVMQTDLNQNDKDMIADLYWLDYQCLFPNHEQ